MTEDREINKEVPPTQTKKKQIRIARQKHPIATKIWKMKARRVNNIDTI